MPSVGPVEVLVVLIIALIVFGLSRIPRPELGEARHEAADAEREDDPMLTHPWHG